MPTNAPFDWLAAQLPGVLDSRVLSVALWKWAALLGLIVVAYAVSWIAASVIVRVVHPIVRRSRTALDERLLDVAVGPLRLALALAVFAAGTLVIPLAPPVRALLLAAERAAATLTVTWLLLRMIDLFAGAARARLAAGGRAGAAAMVPVGGKAAKVSVLGLALLAVLQNVGVNITGVLAGLGIGGLAIALAAQKTVENVFGGVTLILDQPVRVGDFCRFGERVGTVEEIGLRSTRIRTLERTVVAVPNAEFAALHLENFSRRDRIWLKATVGLRYETTPDQLRHVLVEIRSMLYAHPRIDPAPARVHAWRDRGELCLPEFPAERVNALRASLDYPPNGAAVARRG